MDTISGFLSNQGFICEQAKTYFSAEDKIASYGYDIILLDITLPDGNGLELLKKVKELQKNNTGILIISAKDSLDDKILGLDLGADDYITKPFHLSELNSRVNAVIRRRKFDGSEILTFNEIRVDTVSKEVKVNEMQMELTKKEYELLIYLITNKNRVLTKEAIAEHLWGEDIDLADNFDFIYTHIKNLRKKIMAKGGQNYLKTMYGMGYKFSDQ
ncbi:MAG: response regulator transcription factor [Bacteroidales bacterium]|nr:response regulator transcription factor [Bacteroidales bacterium]